LLVQIKKPMSANNGIIINRKNYTVYYIPCMDNDYKERLKKFRSLEEAVDFAEKYIDKYLDGYIEYGIRFIK